MSNRTRMQTPNSLSAPQVYWDAGEMGCGELILQLKVRFQNLGPSEVFQLRADDGGAIEDIPAWCGMTGNTLLHQQHPNYWIQKKG